MSRKSPLTIQEIEELEYGLKVKQELPHLAGFPWYKWAKEFYDSTDKAAFLVAANQVSKSSTQIRTAINWATNPDLWKKLWPGLLPGQKPNQFWYFYPTFEVWQTEFETKWEPDFLPRGDFKHDPVFGWNEEYDKGQIKKINFNSGVTIYCKAYSQRIKDLQSGSVHALFCFIAGTMVITPYGRRPIESIKVGDAVLGQNGFETVIRAISRESEIVEVTFSSGNTLTGSPDHPIMTDRGWVSMGELTSSDRCQKLSLCDYANWMSSFLTRGFSLGINYTQTRAAKIIGVRRLVEMISSTLRYGKSLTVNASQKITSFITRMEIPSIMPLIISSSCHGPITQGYTSSRSGFQKNGRHLLASLAAPNLRAEAQSEPSRGIVRRDAAVRSFLIAAKLAAQRFLRGLIPSRYSAVEPVRTGPLPRARVFNIEVTGSHTYFANDILTHNCDEECPVEFMPELQARLRATDGYMRGVFTATIGQEYWRRVMEPKNPEEELYPNAFKRQVSLYDSQKYVDGRPSRWTDQRIKQIINECPTDAEVQRRVFGRFVKSEGLKVESFDLERNTCKQLPIPKSWGIYGGVDPGSGGKSGHPAAILFVAVRPDYKEGIFFRAWRGDGIATANTDILQKYREMKHGLLIMAQVYDYKDKDFQLTAQASGETFLPAKKQRDEGFGLLNSLFKTGMLKIQRGDSELEKLITEIQSLSALTDKRKAMDDLIDCARYLSMEIPWDFSGMALDLAAAKKYEDAPPDERTEEQRIAEEMLKARRDFALNKSPGPDLDSEFEYWNDLSGAGND